MPPASYDVVVKEHTSRPLERNGVQYSMADQVARFANANATKDARYLDITTVYDGTDLKGKRVLITGAEQGLGYEMTMEIVSKGGHVIQAGRTSSTDLDNFAKANPGAVTIITGIDVCKTEAMAKMVAEVGAPVDIVVNCAGYFYGPAESVGVGCDGHMNYVHQILQIDVCAVGPLRITHALYKGGKIAKGGKVIIITSQAGSCEWRFTQNPTPKPGEEFHGYAACLETLLTNHPLETAISPTPPTPPTGPRYLRTLPRRHAPRLCAIAATTATT